MDTPRKKTSDELAHDRTELAAKRTLMAAERSLMAWNRTALSMIGFGFTLYKVLFAIQQAGNLLRGENAPRNAGLFLIAMAVFSMVVGIIEYVQAIKDLREIKYFPLWRPSFFIALFMAAGGVFFFISILNRLF